MSEQLDVELERNRVLSQFPVEVRDEFFAIFLRNLIEFLTNLPVRSEKFVNEEWDIAKVVVERRPGGADLFANLIDAQFCGSRFRKMRISLFQPLFFHKRGVLVTSEYSKNCGNGQWLPEIRVWPLSPGFISNRDKTGRLG